MNNKTSVRRVHPTVLGILGAHGGVGASTVAAVLAVRGGMSGRPVTVIDGHPFGGGLDVMLGADLEPGWRWNDLAAVRGDIDPAALRSRLPSACGSAILSWGRSACSQAPKGSTIAVAEALASGGDLTVIDLPRPDSVDATVWWSLCTDLIVMLEAGVRQVAAAALVLEAVAAVRDVTEAPTVQCVLRERRRHSLDRDQLAALLGVPFIGSITHDRGVEAALTRGEPLGKREGSLARLADSVLADLLVKPVQAA